MVREGITEEQVDDCLPQVESCPNAVIVHFPTKQSDKLIWTGMYLDSMEAIDFGMRIIEQAEISINKEHDS